uniref:Na/K-ATPase subunit beta 1 n=1 Tax=Blattella germanica TaxID=6973 RepID=L8BRR0_BLAGE|nr:Na/K-ATPase subunit beta 1 [Blattella germanica]
MEKTNKFVDPNDRLYSPPPQKTRLQAFKTFLYNPEKGSFLGRTCSSWAQILTFYVIFYACLAGFFAVCMWGMLQTIDDNEPKFQLDSSLIGSSPGLASRPIPEAGREAVLSFSSNHQTWTGWDTMLLDEFLHEYQKEQEEHHPCDYAQHTIPCTVNVSNWGNCTPTNGTKLNSFCMFFKLNKLYGWTAQYYKDENSLPSAMPQQLKDAFKNADERRKVWLSCEGQRDDDKGILGPVHYYPDQGFPGYYYPFKRQKGFRSPVIAVEFENPKLDTEINVECRAWAPNINQDRKEQLGVLNFKLKFN